MTITSIQRLFLLHSDSALNTLTTLTKEISFCRSNIMSLRETLLDKITNTPIKMDENSKKEFSDSILKIEERLNKKISSLKYDLDRIHLFIKIEKNGGLK